MKNFVFIISHSHSGSIDFVKSINRNPRIQIYDTNFTYDHPDILKKIYSFKHKLDNSAAIYGDHLCFNTDFSSNSFYKFAKFIYIARDGRSTLEELMADNSLNYNLERATLYYSYRLRRMCEMSKNTPNAIFLRYKDLCDQKGLKLVEDYLDLKEPLENIDFTQSSKSNLSSKETERCQDAFERYFYYMKNSNLRKVS
jgi:hypothetical protein